MRFWKKVTLATVTVLLLAEIVFSYQNRPRPAAANTPILAGAQVPPAVLAILDRSCLDCHSNNTRYPWYSYIAPVSILVNRDVQRGRDFLNLSLWDAYPKLRRQRALTGIANQVQDGIMPLEIYLRFHPEARLAEQDRQTLFEWTQAERLRLIFDSNPTLAP